MRGFGPPIQTTSERLPVEPDSTAEPGIRSDVAGNLSVLGTVGPALVVNHPGHPTSAGFPRSPAEKQAEGVVLFIQSYVATTVNISRAVSAEFLVRILMMVVSFVGIAYFSRTLGATELGVFFLFKAALAFLAIPADFGTRLAIEKRISEGGSTRHGPGDGDRSETRPRGCSRGRYRPDQGPDKRLHRRGCRAIVGRGTPLSRVRTAHDGRSPGKLRVTTAALVKATNTLTWDGG